MISNNKIIIKPLNEFPDATPILAHWSYLEWYKDRTISFDTVLKYFRNISNNASLPYTYIALHNTLPVGMATLKDNDLWARKDLNPWLSSLYVIEDYRKTGIGELLTNTIIQKSVDSGHNKIYLFLSQKNRDMLYKYYTKRGWEYFEDTVDNDGYETKILYRMNKLNQFTILDSE
ncbi:GNAT family N-acetyltransferase [Spirochaetota bacterium]